MLCSMVSLNRLQTKAKGIKQYLPKTCLGVSLMVWTFKIWQYIRQVQATENPHKNLSATFQTKLINKSL